MSNKTHGVTWNFDVRLRIWKEKIGAGRKMSATVYAVASLIVRIVGIIATVIQLMQ